MLLPPAENKEHIKSLCHTRISFREIGWIGILTLEMFAVISLSLSELCLDRGVISVHDLDRYGVRCWDAESQRCRKTWIIVKGKQRHKFVLLFRHVLGVFFIYWKY